MGSLIPFDEGVYTVAAPHRWMGLRVGTRATIVRLPDGGLWVHSPVPLTSELAAEVDALGPVRHIVCPNYYHHSYAAQWTEAYPEAALHGPPALASKRRDLTFRHALGDPRPEWQGELVPLSIEGCKLRETVFVHPRTRTVVSADLTENFRTSDHAPTRWYLKMSGIHGKVGWSRLLRFLYHDRKAARASIDRLLEHDFDRLVIAHGEVITKDAKQAIRDTFSFLGKD